MTIRITAHDHAATTLLWPALPKLLASRPDIKVELVIESRPADIVANRPRPRAPQDLTAQSCINLRLPTHGGLYAWEFEQAGRALRVRVEGQLTFNRAAPMLDAALTGFGLADLPEDQVRTHLGDGRLIRVLAAWRPPFPGYHLHCPSRRQPTPAFALLVDALRCRGCSALPPIQVPP